MQAAHDSLPKTLYPFQAEGVRLISEHFAGDVLLADPPGAGKTCQAILAAERTDARRVLIICPASLRQNWEREVERWAPGRWRVHCLYSGKEVRQERLEGSRCVVILSYDLATRSWVAGQNVSCVAWDLLILDEAHFLRSVRSRRTTACLTKVKQRAKRTLALTGTPLPNGRAAEAWPLFAALCPKEFGSFKDFSARYCVREPNPFGQGFVYRRSKNLDELGRRARELFMIRRSKEEVLSQLPPLVRQQVPLSLGRLTAEEQRLCEESLSLSADALRAFDALSTIAPSGHISTVRKDLGVLKVPAAAEFISDLLEEESCAVVFAHHREVLSGLRAAFDGRGITFVFVDGGTAPTARQQAVDDFMAGKARVFLASLLAANTGLTLTRSRCVVMAEADWVPSNNEQAEGRVFRLTQTEITRVFYLVVPNSLDDAVTAAVLRKQRDIGKVLGESMMKTA